MRKSSKLKKSKSYTPLKQLYMVLPKSSLKNILTDMDYKTDTLEYSLFLYDKFYPDKITVDIYNKKYLWQTKIFFDNINEDVIDLFLH
jgi:5'-3' exonuclease